MDYYLFKSIIASNKNPVVVDVPTESLYHQIEEVNPFVAPTFTKEVFEFEKPSIFLVSAIGASGKTHLAKAISHDIGLPVLDLSRHKSVGANSLTGLLTSAYESSNIGKVLQGLQTGTHGVIIDGIDEGRSKTSEHAFEAFLDDLIKLSEGASSPSLVLLGRSQVLVDTFLYLEDKNTKTCMVKLDPFGLDDAKRYIDDYAQPSVNHIELYQSSRDHLLDLLEGALSKDTRSKSNFNSFVGYPPVLDAVATLLRDNKNYSELQSAIGVNENKSNLGSSLLISISEYLVDRERNEKAGPNFIDPLLSGAGGQHEKTVDGIFKREEQCGRVLNIAMRETFDKEIIEDRALNEKYEECLQSWIIEHPFLVDSKIRNIAFEAYSVAVCAISPEEYYKKVALNYVSHYGVSYLLFLIINELLNNNKIDYNFFNILIQSFAELKDVQRNAEVEIAPSASSNYDEKEKICEIELTLQMHQDEHVESFCFTGEVPSDVEIQMGPSFVNAKIVLPCDLRISGSPRIDFYGENHIIANKLTFEASDFSISPDMDNKEGAFLLSEVQYATGVVNNVTARGVEFDIICKKHDLTYPLAQYVLKEDTSRDFDPMAKERYKRLRRILLEFQSHSKGRLAKYRKKIEHQRVLRGPIGEAVLKRLLELGIIYADNNFYYIEPVKYDEHLGLPWPDLRQHKSSIKVVSFLKELQE